MIFNFVTPKTDPPKTDPDKNIIKITHFSSVDHNQNDDSSCYC